MDSKENSRREAVIRQQLTYEEILDEIKGTVGNARFDETYPLIKILASRLLEEQEYWLEIEKLLHENLSKDDFKRRDLLSKRAADLSRTIKQLFEVVGFTPDTEGSVMDNFDTEQIKENKEEENK